MRSTSHHASQPCCSSSCPKPLSQWRRQRPVAVRVRLRTWCDRCARKGSRTNKSAGISRRRAFRKAESHSSSTRCRCSCVLRSAVLWRARKVQRRRLTRRQRRVGTHERGARLQSARARKRVMQASAQWDSFASFVFLTAHPKRSRRQQAQAVREVHGSFAAIAQSSRHFVPSLPPVHEVRGTLRSLRCHAKARASH